MSKIQVCVGAEVKSSIAGEESMSAFGENGHAVEISAEGNGNLSTGTSSKRHGESPMYKKVELVLERMRKRECGVEALDELMDSTAKRQFEIVGNKFLAQVFQGYHDERSCDVYVLKTTSLNGNYTSFGFVLHELKEKSKSKKYSEFVETLERHSRDGKLFGRLIVQAGWDLVDSDTGNNVCPWLENITNLTENEGINDIEANRLAERIELFIERNKSRLTTKDANDFNPQKHIGIYTHLGRGGNIAISRNVLFEEILNKGTSPNNQLKIKRALVRIGFLVDRDSTGCLSQFAFRKGDNGVKNYLFNIKNLGEDLV